MAQLSRVTALLVRVRWNEQESGRNRAASARSSPVARAERQGGANLNTEGADTRNSRLRVA